MGRIIVAWDLMRLTKSSMLRASKLAPTLRKLFPPDAEEEPLDADEMVVVMNDTLVGNRSAEEVLNTPGSFASMQQQQHS